VPVARFEDTELGFGFDYQEGAVLLETATGVRIRTTVGDVTGTVFIARGTPEELAAQGVICESPDSNDPRRSLRCITTEVEPTVTTRYGSPMWQISRDEQAAGGNQRVATYIVALGPEWVYIQTSARVGRFETAQREIFEPLLNSLLILGFPPTPTPEVDVFGFRP
jgi:hypothetical protein